jgi:hypothetical protein
MSEKTPKDALNRIMHARLALEGNGSLYAGDCPPGMPYPWIINGEMIDIQMQS